ncbi:MAG: UDP-N-acetylmuramate dehydrogenase [Gammaproteobacteria bacterium]|nr:UDP-N-acetylmuramate dehydrogenase [Gammaproteobacteria bacterium]
MQAIKPQVSLKELTTFKVDSNADGFLQLDSVDDIIECLSQIQQYDQRLVLGGGSNILMVGDYSGLILYPQLFGINLLDESDNDVLVAVAASENWHNWVLHSSQQGWHGLENLALIPGTVGAAPIQNIGAYGVEVEQFIDYVEYIDLDSGVQHLKKQRECEFAYRDSFFKKAGQGRYLVTQVVFRLLKQPQLNLTYQPLASYFEDKPSVNPADLIERVCEIRRSKLPDPELIPNAGSFFKNPVVAESVYEQLKQSHPDLVAYPVDEGFKLAAGWLIEKAGFKGVKEGDVGVHTQQALVLVNYGETDGRKIWQLAEKIQQSVLQQFGVVLEAEVRIEGRQA